VIEISPEHYDGFLTTCRHTLLPAYAFLKNGVVVRRQIEGKELQQVSILCEEYQAHNLLVVARSLQSPVAEDIQKALDIALEL